MNHIQPWTREAADQIMGDRDRAWRELSRISEDHLDAIGDRARKVSEFKVSNLGDRDLAMVKTDAANLAQHLVSGGKFGFGPLRPKAVKDTLYLINEVRVNGCLCDNLQSLSDLAEYIEILEHLEILKKYWSVYIEPPSGPFHTQVAEYHDLCEPLTAALGLHDKITELREKISLFPRLAEPNWCDLKGVNTLRQVIVAVRFEEILSVVQGRLKELESRLHHTAINTDAHPVVNQIVKAIQDRDEESYAIYYQAVSNLVESRKKLKIREDRFGRLQAAAPRLTSELMSGFEDPVWDDRMKDFTAAWKWAQADSWLRRLNEPQAQERIASNLDACRSRIHREIGKLVEAKAWRHCFSRLKEEERQHLVAWTKAIKRIGKGKGKTAGMHRREARKHMEKCRSAIPAWIMPIYRVAETVRPGKDAFDVVIVDEASQSGPEALFLNFLARKVVVVGDDKQISPEFIGITREDVELLRQRYLSDIPHSDALGVDNSFFDQAEIRYGGRIRLREHFRCMPEIIQFSNNLCYSSEPLVPLRQYGIGRLSPVILEHHVVDGYQKGSLHRVVNPPEADAIVDQITRCCEDPAYKGKSMGVISLLGQGQARLIESLLLNKIGPEEMEERGLVCGDAYAFQGDERDVMFLSLVSAPTEGKRIGTLASSRDERRFNVAASRAKDQMWLFHTATLNDLSPNCVRYKLLEYCQNPRVEPVTLDGIDMEKLREIHRVAHRDKVKPPHPFDSWFEIDVFLKIVDRGYRVIPQFRVAGYSIDLVVEGMKGRLAVECDGDEWHGINRYEQDQARQRQLERCGWTFWRVRGSSFYRDPEEALQGLWGTLKRLGISPETDEQQKTSQSNDEKGKERKSSNATDRESDANETGPGLEEDQSNGAASGAASGKANESERKEAAYQTSQQDLSGSRTKRLARERRRDKKGEKTSSMADLGIDPSNLIDPLPHIVHNLLSENARKCKSCGATAQVLIGRFGPFLLCSDEKCKGTTSVGFAILKKAFEILQIPCSKCGGPMRVAKSSKGPFPGCSRFPQCKTAEPWKELRERIKEKDVRQLLGDSK